MFRRYLLRRTNAKRILLCVLTAYILYVITIAYNTWYVQRAESWDPDSKEEQRQWSKTHPMSEETAYEGGFGRGLPFGVKKSLLEELGVPLLNKFTLREDSDLEDFVFVTAASSRFYGPVQDTISTIQTYFPDKSIYFYDLGLNDEEAVNVRTICNVVYRKLDFSLYPAHLRVLRTYAWKPAIIHEVLTEHPGVFWVDSSVRFYDSDVSDTFPVLRNTGGITLFNYAGHNTFSVTHPGMLDYLPSDVKGLQTVFQYEANCMLIFRTHAVYNDVILWWLLCALQEKCIAPTREISCRFTKPDQYAHCHRYDQTAINILLSNKFQFDHWSFALHPDNLEKIQRYSHKGLDIKHCS